MERHDDERHRGHRGPVRGNEDPERRNATMRKYTLTDRLYDMRYDLYMNWPGRFAPLASIRVIAAAANMARLVGAMRLARFLVQWSWDIADVPIKLSAAAFDLHREVLPWAWEGYRLRKWCYTQKALDLIASLRGGR